MGVVGLPSRVTGLAAISMSEEITFMPGWCASSNSSQYGLVVGVDWRLIFMRTDLLAIVRYLYFARRCHTNEDFIPPMVLASGNVSVSCETFVEHLAILYSFYIEHAPSGNAPAAASTNLPAK